MHFIVMAMFAIMLTIGFAAQGQTATAKVYETAVFDQGENRYLLSRSGEVDNHYTGAVITKRLNTMTFVMKVGADSSYTSVYQITERKMGRRILLAKKLDGSNAQIKIIQKKNSLEVLCDFNEEANRFDASIVFTDIQFQ